MGGKLKILETHLKSEIAISWRRNIHVLFHEFYILSVACLIWCVLKGGIRTVFPNYTYLLRRYPLQNVKTDTEINP